MVDIGAQIESRVRNVHMNLCALALEEGFHIRRGEGARRAVGADAHRLAQKHGRVVGQERAHNFLRSQDPVLVKGSGHQHRAGERTILADDSQRGILRSEGRERNGKGRLEVEQRTRPACGCNFRGAPS